MTTYKAGSPSHPGTMLHRNVTGECPHDHRSPEAAQRCIDTFLGGFVDRDVMVDHDERGRHVLGEWCECGECRAAYLATTEPCEPCGCPFTFILVCGHQDGCPSC